MKTPVALTIAGSDPSGGAGVQADLKTFHQHGVYGMAVISLLTVQNTKGVFRVEVQPPDLVRDQLQRVLEDIRPDAVKTGALGNAAVIDTVTEIVQTQKFPLVVDPVMISKHGAPLIDEAAIDALKRLLRVAFLVTPNIFEAERLTGQTIRSEKDVEYAARACLELGSRYVFVKGGHLGSEPNDFLLGEGHQEWIRGTRIDSCSTHGTGCVLSAAIAARLARGQGILDTVREAKRFVAGAIATHPGLGQGVGPTNMFSKIQ